MTLIVGDALNVFPGLEPESFDAVIADPPYSSGGAMRTDRNAATGTTLEAGQLSGLEVVGIERLDEWATFAADRVAQLPLFTGRDI